MPYRSLGRKCKYCDKPAKHNIVNKINKGYCATCGDEKCLKMAYNLPEVIEKKKYLKEHLCEICKKPYLAKGRSQIWCRTCIPNKRFSALMQRYKLTKDDWDRMVLQQNGKCKLCNKLPKVVDHDHDTGKIRGLLCYGCNLLVGLIERDKNWLINGLNYISNV